MSAKQWIMIVFVAAAGAGAGWLAQERLGGDSGQGNPGSSMPEEKSGPCPGGAQPAYWKSPMDPTYIRNEPGKSPMGMDLVPECAEGGGQTGSGIRIDPTYAQNMGVRLARVKRRDLSRTIRAVGRVAYDERLVVHVHTKVQGWVEKLRIDYEGQTVKRGEPLLEIYSPELVSTQEELLVAARYRDDTAASPFPDVRNSGAALFDSSRRRLELWDIAGRDIDRLLESGEVRKNLTLYSPAKGVVTHLMVREGEEVSPNKNLYTIADLSRIWVFADVYEYELPWIAVGQTGIVELSYLPGKKFQGIVTYVYPFLDPKTRTVRVRLELENPKILLKPNMFANVSIQAETRRGTLVVPDEAVLRSGSQTRVFVALAEGRFEPRTITLGLDSGDGLVEVIDGLREGENVVVSGQFLIDSESRLKEAVRKMLEPEAQGGDGDERGMSADSGMEGMDHSGHDMPGEKAIDHSGHDMPDEKATDHSGHDMPDEKATDHSGHDMPDVEN